MPAAIATLTRTPTPDLLARFKAIVGEKFAITDPLAQAPYLTEQRDLWHCHSPMVLRPGSVAEVSAILKLANETATPIVPQGGNTGLVGGGVPSAVGGGTGPQMAAGNRACPAGDGGANRSDFAAGVPGWAGSRAHA